MGDPTWPFGATAQGCDALHEAREIFRLSFEMSLVGMAIVGTDGQYKAVNQTLCDILGRNEKDLLALGPTDITHPDDVDRDRALIGGLLRGELPTYRIDKRYLDRDGNTIWVALHASTVSDVNGTPLYMVGQIEDLRATKTALNAAERTETELKTLAASLPIGIYRSDPNGRCVYANTRWREIYGIGEVALGGWEWINAIHDDDVDRVLAEISAASKSSGPFASSFRVRWPNGDVRWVQATANAVLDDEGGARGFVGSVEDITDRMHGDQLLAEATLRFRRAFDNAPIGMALVAPDGGWLTVNAALTQLLGYAEHDLLARTFQDITHPDDLDDDLALLHQMLDGTIETYSLEKRYLHRTGRTVWVNLSVSLVQDASGAPLYFVSQIEDITDRKHAEDRLTTYAQRLASTNNELVEFTSVAAHDLAEPLRVIEGYLHLLSTRCSDELTEEARTFIAHAVGGAERLQHLIDDLLTYSRATQSSGASSLVDLNSILEHNVAALGIRAIETNAKITIGDLPVVAGNERQLGQLFQNLLSNALTFSKPEEAPCVDISAARGEGTWVISVADRGIGIPAEHRDRVFGMFKRLHGRDDYPGTGIGLAICRKVVEAHNGTIEVADVQTGTTLRVSLPDRPARHTE